VEQIFGSAKRDEARGGARGAVRHVQRSNPENVASGFRGFEAFGKTWRRSFGAGETDGRYVEELYQSFGGRLV
jgi:hypothetical protein